MKLTKDSDTSSAHQFNSENIDPLVNVKAPNDIIDIRNVKLTHTDTTYEKVIKNDQIVNEQLLMDITNIKNLTIESYSKNINMSKSENKSNENELNDTKEKVS